MFKEKKLLWRICGIVLLCVCMCFLQDNIAYADNVEELVYEGFVYEIQMDDTIQILNYEGSAANVVVPSEIDGKTVVAIQGACFNYNNIMQELTIPNTVKYLGAIGYGCSKLEKVTINAYLPQDLADTTFTYGNGLFASCPKLKNIVVNENEILKTFYVKDNVLYFYGNDVDSLVLYPGGKMDTEYTFTESLQIGQSAFEGNAYIEKVVFEKPLKDNYTYNVESGIWDKVIDTNCVFRFCTSLKEVSFTGLTEIGGWFDGCTALEKCVIPDTVVKIRSMMFNGCTSLKELEIPASVKYIDNTLCQDCTELEKCVVYSDDVMFETDEQGMPYGGVWNSCNKLTLYCNEGSTTESYAKMYHLNYKYIDDMVVDDDNEEALLLSSVKLSEKAITLRKGKSCTLKATVTPINATNTALAWKSSNTKVAVVDKNGKVTAKGYGATTITAIACDGSGVKASCKVTVGYNITYKLNNGTNNENNPAVYYKEKITLKSPTRKGYAFKGWYTDKKCKNKISTIKKTAKKNYTLYAKWEKVSVKKTSISSAKNSKSKSIVLKYKKSSGAKGYEISYSKDKKFKKSVTKKVTTKTSNTIKKLEKGKTYYVRVRAYKIDSTGKKVYSSYSKVVKVKIKK